MHGSKRVVTKQGNNLLRYRRSTTNVRHFNRRRAQKPAESDYRAALRLERVTDTNLHNPENPCDFQFLCY